MEYVRFSARGVSRETVVRLRNVAKTNRTVIGAILDEAVQFYWDLLEEEQDDAPTDNTEPDAHKPQHAQSFRMIA